ncbi:MAG: hypothetical protein MR803_04555 [Clostridiales bacterium]|nr:hypothetical protein [Clostridiales bacterium]
MQSKTSFSKYFNATLLRRNLTRFWPLWGMASFAGSLFPLALLVQFLRDEDFYLWNRPLDFTEMYYYAAAYAVPIVSLLYAILCAMLVWSYLYNSRSVGLMHTLPIRREGLFFTNFLSGMAMMLIPYVIVGGLCVVVSLVGGCFDAKGLGVTILAVLGLSFFYFATATAAAFITGNIFALPAVYFLLHFLAVMLDWLVCTFSQGFIFGLSGGYSGVVEWLSPTVYLENHLRVSGTYEEAFQRGELTGTGYYTDVLTAVELQNLWLVGVYALAGAALLAIAWLLYRRRRSESAGDVVAVGWMKPVFRCGVTGLAALLGGLLLYELFWRSFQESQYYEVLPLLVCMLVAGAIGYYGASMLLAKSLRVFRGSWRGLLLTAAGCAVVCAVLHFDVLGVADRVPEVSRVEKMTLYTADNNYTFYPDEDEALMERVRAVHQAITADRDYIVGVTGQEDWWSQPVIGDASFHVTYYLSSGLKVDRTYYLPISRQRLTQAGTYDNLLDSLVNSEEMKARRIHLNDARFAPTGGSVYVERRNEGYDLSSRECAALQEAVARDAAAGAWGDYQWFNAGVGGEYALSLELSFTYTGEDGDPRRDWISITLRPGMDNTISCLKELGFITEADLVTNRELYPEDTWEMEEKFAQEMAAVESADVIGGADGSTTVYVTG